MQVEQFNIIYRHCNVKMSLETLFDVKMMINNVSLGYLQI